MSLPPRVGGPALATSDAFFIRSAFCMGVSPFGASLDSAIFGLRFADTLLDFEDARSTPT